MKKLLFLLLFLSLTFTSYAAETQGQNILTGEDYKEDVVSLNEELRKLHKGIKKITDTDTDIKAKVSSNDTTAGYLNGKLVAGTGITLTENTDGGNETLTITNTVTPMLYADSRFKIGSFTATNATGTQAITSIGFTPKFVVFSNMVSGIAQGWDDGTSRYCWTISGVTPDYAPYTTYSQVLPASLANYITFYITSFDADGFTITKTQFGAGNTGTVYYTAYR